MKLTLLLLLVVASVALSKAHEEQDEPSMNDLLNGSLEDEVLGNDDDAANLRRKGSRRVCGRVFHLCLKKTRYRCRLIPLCKAHYYRCRCNGIKRKGDEIEENDAVAKRRHPPKFVQKCKLRYKACKRGKKFCRRCLVGLVVCLKKRGGRDSKQDEQEDEAEDEETMMANVAESNDNDVVEEQQDESDPGRRPQLNKAQKRCLVSALRCILKARVNCRQQGRCLRRGRRCFRSSHCKG